jgi:hypothetical protein
MLAPPLLLAAWWPDPAKWCAREDLNLHPLRDQILSLACLPFHHSRNLRVTMPIITRNLKPVLCDNELLRSLLKKELATAVR